MRSPVPTPVSANRPLASEVALIDCPSTATRIPDAGRPPEEI